MKPRNVILLVICLAAAGIVAFGLIRDGQRKQVAVNQVNGATNTDVVENGGIVSTCVLTPKDVPNVPEGWSAHIFPGPCMGLAFPLSPDGLASSEGEGTDWSGEFFRLQNHSDFAKSDKSLDVMVLKPGFFEPDSQECAAFGLGFDFCEAEILESWQKTIRGDLIIYRMSDELMRKKGLSSEQFAFAAIWAKDGRVFTFEFDDRSTKMPGELLGEVLLTFVLGL